MSQLKPVEYDKQSTENKCTSYSLCQLVFNEFISNLHHSLVLPNQECILNDLNFYILFSVSLYHFFIQIYYKTLMQKCNILQTKMKINYILLM